MIDCLSDCSGGEIKGRANSMEICWTKPSIHFTCRLVNQNSSFSGSIHKSSSLRGYSVAVHEDGRRPFPSLYVIYRRLVRVSFSAVQTMYSLLRRFPTSVFPRGFLVTSVYVIVTFPCMLQACPTLTSSSSFYSAQYTLLHKQWYK